jgi:magnesium transporter
MRSPTIEGPTAEPPRILEFDFATKQVRPAGIERLGPAAAEGHYLWIDLDVSDVEAAREVLVGLDLLEAPLVEAALSAIPDTRLTRFDDYLFLALTGFRVRGELLGPERVNAFVAEHFLLTVHHGPVCFLEATNREYHADFVRFAKGPSFLLYELLEHLTENFFAGQRCLASRVEGLQTELIGDIDDSVFQRVAALGNDVLAFRKMLVPARSVLTELALRRSPFVSEETRPFLSNMEATVERVLADVLADREILSGSLDLYMSMVGHRTNLVMKRLTAVSIIFLPLTFLCGVYGMNFRVLPELEWAWGYAYFWCVAVVVVLGLVGLLRRNRIL